jgi:hypothetical protein
VVEPTSILFAVSFTLLFILSLLSLFFSNLVLFTCVFELICVTKSSLHDCFSFLDITFLVLGSLSSTPSMNSLVLKKEVP